MKAKQIVLILLLLTGKLLSAHTINYDHVILRHWVIEKENKTLDGTYYMLKNGDVYIEDAQNSILHFPLADLSQADQAFALQKNEWVKKINNRESAQLLVPVKANGIFDLRFGIVVLLLVILSAYIFAYSEKKRLKYLLPILFVGVAMSLYSFTERVAHYYSTTTDPLFIDSAFTPFKPKVNTFWDATYFHVESQGIPDHQMMTGIVAWQQQVPIPQCYIGTNSWSIPLNPVIAATPVPVSPQHFLRGAVAIAANGVAIFNPYTNTGVDALVDGQLDNFGGHCGRADDYHYHVAPLSLYSQTSPTLPIAFGLDGFAVYGSLEPDGSPMLTLDANHGHYGTNGVYHYHGTVAAPYMIGNMVGVVTEDTTLQIIPQARANPVRPSLTPLSGAVITDCQPNGTNNGYDLTYTRNGQTYHVNYSWTPNGTYTFHFVSPTATIDSVYHGFSQCVVPTAVQDLSTASNSISIYPNPALNGFTLQLGNGLQEKDVREISIYDMNGKLVYGTANYRSAIDFGNLAKGKYMVTVKMTNDQITKTLVVQ